MLGCGSNCPKDIYTNANYISLTRSQSLERAQAYPVGLGYLAAVLREGGHEVMIYDAAIEDYGVDYYLDKAEAERRPLRPDRCHCHHAPHPRCLGAGETWQKRILADHRVGWATPHDHATGIAATAARPICGLCL